NIAFNALRPKLGFYESGEVSDYVHTDLFRNNAEQTQENKNTNSPERDFRGCLDGGLALRHGTSPNHRHARLTGRDDNHRWQTNPAARSEIWWRDQGHRCRFQTVLAANSRPSEGRAQRAPHHDRRSGLWRLQHLWRRDPDAGDGPDCEGGIALYA